MYSNWYINSGESMNYIFFGRSCDLNIGNGKTVSAIRLLMHEHLILGKTVFSNIKLNGIEYTPFTPDNIGEILETENAFVLFDEIHAIIPKNDRILPGCKKHIKLGLCYDMVQMFRQVRKNDITTASTAQTFGDCVYQLRVVMQQMIICEKFHIEKGVFRKCETDKCPESHGNHFIKQTNYRNGEILYFEPEMFYKFYDSNEIVKGWNKL